MEQLTLPTAPMLAEADIGQIIFVILFLIVGFVQWVIKVIKEKAEAAERARQMPTQEDIAARRAAWEEQTRVPQPPPMPAAPPSTLDDLLGEFRRVMETAQPAPAPPPLPRPAPRTVPAPAPAKVMPAPAAPSALPPVFSGAGRSSTVLEQRRRPAHRYTALLHSPDGYRQAFVLREVLGPPRAFQDYSGQVD